jgi:Rieske Fe-S protein
MSDEQAVTGSGVQTRRALLAGAGAVGASVVLAACGGDGSTGGGTTNAPTTGGPAAEPTGVASGNPGGATALAKTGDIPVGGGKIFAAQRVVVTQPTAGDFKCFSAICTHQGCPVTSVDGGTINCACHGSKFSVQDGSVKGGPATRPLAAKDVKVDGGSITLG